MTPEPEEVPMCPDRTDPDRARAHAITLLAADTERVERLERDLAQARDDLEASRRLAALCGVTNRAVA
jgi:S-adenosylmethionine/arginine decarboxylase-like enzyme